jgi:autotransporter translocation and assembly factor TamB
MTKRALAIVLILLLGTAAWAFSFGEWKSSLNDQVKAEATKSFSALFGHPVTIGGAGGRIVGQIILKNVTFPRLGHADSIVLDYSVIKYAWAKGDILPALSRITVVGGDFTVSRDRQGEWNVLSLLPRSSGAKATPPPFKGRLVLKNCRADYRDDLGWRPQAKTFTARATEINGTIDLRRAGVIKLALQTKVPEPVKINGSVNSDTGRFAFDLSGQELQLPRWVNYAVPLPGLQARSGTADLLLNLASPKTPGWPVSVVGKFTLKRAAFDYAEIKSTALSGEIFLSDQNISCKDLQSNVEVADKVQAAVNVTGRLNSLEAAGRATIVSGRAFGQNISGPCAFNYANNELVLQGAGLNLYRGRALVNAVIKFAPGRPEINAVAELSGLSLAALAQSAPGFEGNIGGLLEVNGPFDRLSGKLDAKLSRALAFGQPLDGVTASFQVTDGDFRLESLRASSPTAWLAARGSVTKGLFCDLQVEAKGLRLAGKGLLGPQRVTVKSFDGNVKWQITPAFFASPLRNITATGSTELSDGVIGEQTFDQAAGQLSIGQGKISVSDTFIRKGNSRVLVSGQTGSGVPTDLLLSSAAVRAEDLKLLNYFLPEDLRNITGDLSVEARITGELSKETKLESVEPLLDLTLQSHVLLTKATVADIPVNLLRLDLGWSGRRLSLSHGRLQLAKTDLSFELAAERDGALQGTVEGVADLGVYSSLTEKFGKIKGTTGLKLELSGRLNDPKVTAGFWIEKFSFNSLYFDKITGSFVSDQGKFSLIDPLVLEEDKNKYSLTGSISAESADLTFEVQADLANVYRQANRLRGEIISRIALPTSGGKVKISLFTLSSPRDYHQLYSSKVDRPTLLKNWNAIRLDAAKRAAVAAEENLGGDTRAALHLRGKLTDLRGNLSGTITKGQFRGATFDKLTVDASLEDGVVSLTKATLEKERGTIVAKGSYGLNGGLALFVKADNAPLSVLKAIFPGKEFKGSFNLLADFSGPLDGIKTSLSASSRQITLAGLDFDRLSISLGQQGNSINIREFSLLQKDLLSRVYGTVTSDGDLDLAVDLKGSALGLLNLFNEEVRWQKGSAVVKGTVKGSFSAPDIDGTVALTDATVQIKALNADLRNVSGEASITNNLALIGGLTGLWIGRSTRDWPNSFGLAGTIDLKKVFSSDPGLDLNLAFSPTRVTAFFPGLFTGQLYLDQLSLKGPLAFDLSSGPTLAGKVRVTDAVLTISPSSGGGKNLPLKFDLSADLNKNVYVVMGDIATLNLSNIFMDLEIGGQDLKIFGDLNAPRLLGKINVKRGTVNIFNREFLLLTEDQQGKYFPYDPSRVQNNLAVFRGEEGTAGVLPELNITSSVNVENQEKDQSGQYVKKSVFVLARLTGTVGAKDEQSSLKISLFGFNEDKTKSPSEMVPGAYSDQDLKVLLLPDFIKSLAGLGQGQPGTANPTDTNAVVADYLSSRMQTLLFRGLEREVEQKLGLESLTLDYNFGPKMREALGSRDTRSYAGEEKPAWSVGFVKGFFDRLYIDVRYSQPMDQTGTNVSAAATQFNYQLTYKLSPIWSIIYYREPATLTTVTTGYQKVTLKAGLSFW